MTSLAFAALIFAAAAGPASAASSAGRDCRGCPEMVKIPAGKLNMGSPDSEPGRDPIEGPQHRVSVRSFAIGRYDVSRGEWARFVAATRRTTIDGCQWSGPSRDHDANANWRRLGFTQDDTHPVVCVTWHDARDYAAWLSRKTHHHYRLPSEAEWEYAARGGTATAYWWGTGPSHDFANHGTEECCGGRIERRDRWRFTSPGNAFPANGFGLHDMAGNVLQYVADCFMPSYAGAPTDGAARTMTEALKTSGDLADLNGKSSCDYRVVRGGDWGDRAAWVRAASRSFAPPPERGAALANYRSGGVGFRVVRDLP